MPDKDQLSLRQADQIRGDLYGIQDDLDFIKVQLAQLPTRNEVWRAAMLGMIGGAVAAVTVIDAFSRSFSKPSGAARDASYCADRGHTGHQHSRGERASVAG